MSYIDTLIETKKNVEESSDLKPNEKLIILNLIENERIVKEAEKDSFIYLFKNITSRDNLFEFQPYLGDSYPFAKEHASSCINIFNDFSKLEANAKLHNWLSSAIKVVDFIAIHYIQEVLEEEPVKHQDHGKERSRYIQINQNGISAQKAGRIMENLYGDRNKMEHQTKNDPNNPTKQIMVTPKYSRVLRNIKKNFPTALITFDDAYKEHYA
ncbi:hypothetical protein [Aliivibrio fischeri]|uniref:hypothetical protein n=1 Tax=Aliivibrio fischeri TaxID=668 RepID=UPI00105F9009|nr:hypothetical protein [Aliivibrio fischeri]TDM55097.1 hypothetical protein VFFQA001_11225 [Aliivibrio fischeri]